MLFFILCEGLRLRLYFSTYDNLLRNEHKFST